MKSVNNLIWRGIILFLIGTLFTYVLCVLQSRRSSTSHAVSGNFRESVFYSKWWLPLICGAGSAFIGLIYPQLKSEKEGYQSRCHEWSQVLRCVAMFVGINEAYTKIDFPSDLQLSATLAILSIGLWYYVDRTSVGFGIGATVAALATSVMQFLAYQQICIYSDAEFVYVKSWLPCVVFSGGITVASIGNKLAVEDMVVDKEKLHSE